MIIDPRKELAGDATAELGRLGISIVGVVGYGLEALESVYEHRPELVIIRVAEPTARPLQLIERLRDALPDSPVIAVTSDPGSPAAEQAIAAGAFACVAPGRRGQALVSAIRSAAAYAERRRRDLTALAQTPGEVITVVGAKGGVGKTTVATNLAVALAVRCPDSVALVDADPAFGDVALALDLPSSRTLADVAADVAADGESFNSGNAREYMTQKFGLWVLPARAGIGVKREVPPDEFVHILQELRRAFDFVVVDTGGAMTELTYAAAGTASTRILVTTPETASVRDASRAVRLLRTIVGQGNEPQILLNRASMPGGLTPDEVAREVGLDTRWLVKEDRRISTAMQEGVPAVIRYAGRGPSETFRVMAESFTGVGQAGSGGNGPSQRPRAALRLWSFQR